MSTVTASYPVGTRPRVTFTFTDASNVVEDPSGVSVYVMDPTGTPVVLTYAGATVTKASTGVYYVDRTLSIAGVWYFRAESPDGNGRAVSDDVILTATATHAK